MGFTFFDQYSLLHFSVGVALYFWGMTLTQWVIIHTLFEIIENTSYMVHFIDKYLTIWPGGKTHPDAVINSVGDVFFGTVGFIFAQQLDKFYNSK